MPEVSKTAKRSAGVKIARKRYCTLCKTGETIVVKFAGFGPHGFFWVCQGAEATKERKAAPPCGFQERTR